MLLVAFGSSNHIGMFPAYSSQLQSPGIWMLKDREAKDSAFRGLRALTCSGPHLMTGTGVFSLSPMWSLLSGNEKARKRN